MSVVFLLIGSNFKVHVFIVFEKHKRFNSTKRVCNMKQTEKGILMFHHKRICSSLILAAAAVFR